MTAPEEHGSEIEPSSGWPTESIIFLVLGVFALVIDIIYVLTTKPGGVEYAGAVALLGAAMFSFFFAFFLRRDLRRVQADVEHLEEAVESGELAEDAPEALYLPETSIWPVGIAVGAALTAASLGFGWWFMIPGIALLIHSSIGFAHQSRERRRY